MSFSDYTTHHSNVNNHCTAPVWPVSIYPIDTIDTVIVTSEFVDAWFHALCPVSGAKVHDKNFLQFHNSAFINQNKVITKDSSECFTTSRHPVKKSIIFYHQSLTKETRFFATPSAK